MMVFLCGPGKKVLLHIVRKKRYVILDALRGFAILGITLGNKVGLLVTELIALGVYAFQTGFSALWLRRFKFGPVEWIWRMLTYGKTLPIRNSGE